MQQRAPYRACGRGSIPTVPLFRCVRLNVEPRFRDVAHPRCETLTLASPLILVLSLASSVSSHRRVVVFNLSSFSDTHLTVLHLLVVSPI